MFPIKQARTFNHVFVVSRELHLNDVTKYKPSTCTERCVILKTAARTRERGPAVRAARSGSFRLVLWKLPDGERGFAGIADA